MIPKSNCRECDKTLWDDAMSSPSPKCGDLAVCIFCGCINELDENLRLILPKEITEQARKASMIVKKRNNKLKFKEAFPGNKNYMLITEMYAFISSDDEEEGVIAMEIMVNGRDTFLPFVMADKARLESLRPHAEQIAKFSNKKIKLIKFIQRIDIEEINP